MKLTANPASEALPVQQRHRCFEAQFLRIMKLTTIIILAACLQSAANGIAQNTVTFSGKEVSLENVFNAIKKQTSYRFFFNTDMLQHTSKITIEVKNAPIEQVMHLALKDQPLTFAIKGRTIFIMKKQEEEKSSSQAMPPTGDPMTVSGRILDENGAPAVSVNIAVKGTNKGTTTNIKGEFTLEGVDKNGVLIITSIGYDKLEIPIVNKNFITVKLKVAVGNLDELQVIAYGTTSKRLNTGNVSTVKAADIEGQPVNNPLLAIQGRVPGLFITQSAGVPGSRTTVRIQGINSIGSGNDPLYVIDGVPYVSQMLLTTSGQIFGGQPTGIGSGLVSGGGDPLSYINPADIESIDVLKDADATAIYGSRAANGAILITTKKGKAGEAKVDINAQVGWGKVTRMLKMMNTDQYLEMRREAFKNDNIPVPSILTTPNDGNYDINGLWDTTKNTNWQKELIGGTAKFNRINASVSGGTSSLQYLVSGTFQRETTVFPGDFADKKGSLHFSINSSSANQRFRIQVSGSYMVDKDLLPTSDLTSIAVSLAPNSPALFKEDGTLNWAPTSSGVSSWFEHPLSYIYRIYENKTNNLVGSSILSYRITRSLEVKSSFGYTNLETNEFSANLIESVKPESLTNYTRRADYSESKISTWIIEPNITYKNKFVFGNLDVLLGATIQQQNNDGKSYQGSDYVSDEVLRDMRSAATFKVTNSIISKYKYNALFGRINYSYNDKYIINFNGRRDGSSRFGSNSQFHNFGSIGLGWVFSEEKFMKRNIDFVSFGKLRASYGITGNDQIGDYAFMTLYRNPLGSYNNYQGVSSLQPNGLPNPYLEWEETKKLQLGVDVGIFNDRIFFTTNYVKNKSSNQLLGYNLPLITGASSITTNFPATVQNTAWEITLKTLNISSSKLKWSSNLNVTIPKNKLTKFPNIETSSYANSLVVGKPMEISKALKYVGVNPQTGIYEVEDVNGNPTSTPSFSVDANVIINKTPKYYGGFQNTIQFNNFQIDVFFQFNKQIAAGFPFINVPGRFVLGRNNQPVDVIDRWRKPGDEAEYQKYSQNSSLVNISTQTTTRLYVDASYIRLKNLSVAYSLPEVIRKKIKMRSCKIYANAQNLLTITNYKGMDPENRSIVRLPPLRLLTIGLQTTF